MKGLNINPTEFAQLPQKQQMMVLYENTEELKRMVAGYKYQQKLQWFALGGLAVIVGAGRFLGLI